MVWLNAIVQGVLVGGLYALFAAGLSLIFGVMRLVNIAHGDLIVLAAYVALVCVSITGMNPLLAILVVAPLMALFGYSFSGCCSTARWEKIFCRHCWSALAFPSSFKMHCCRDLAQIAAN